MPELAVDLRKQPHFTHNHFEPIHDLRERCNRPEWPLPSIFLLGAAKCGTTTLSTLLEGLPDVCFSVSKEPWFFEVEYEQGLDYYRRRYFRHWCGESLLAEGRHRNLYLPWVPQRIHTTNPHAKLI